MNLRPRVPPLTHALRLPALLVLFVLCQPMLALMQALVYALTAAALSGAPSEWLELLLQVALRDPRHTSIAVEALQEVHISVLAIGWPLGDFLSWLIPGAVVKPSASAFSTRWAAIVVQPGSTLLAGVVAHVLAAALLLALGRALVHLHGSIREWAAGFGVILQVLTVMDLIRQPLTINDLDTMGLSTIATKVFSASVPEYQAFLAPFERLENASLPVAPSLLALIAAVPVSLLPLTAAGLSRAEARIRARRATWFTAGGARGAGGGAMPGTRRAILVVGIALLTFSPLHWAQGGPSFRSFPVAAAQELPEVGGATEHGPHLSDRVPSVVEITGEHPGYRLLVNGSTLQVRGIGYNVYASHLSPQAGRRTTSETSMSFDPPASTPF
jgi:hypothetical protein